MSEPEILSALGANKERRSRDLDRRHLPEPAEPTLRHLTVDGELAASWLSRTPASSGFDAAQADTFASLAGFPQAQIGSVPGNYSARACVVRYSFIPDLSLIQQLL